MASSGYFAAWNLEVYWSLELGIWSFPGVWCLMLGAWAFSGAWMLELGASTLRSSRGGSRCENPFSRLHRHSVQRIPGSVARPHDVVLHVLPAARSIGGVRICAGHRRQAHGDVDIGRRPHSRKSGTH